MDCRGGRRVVSFFFEMPGDGGWPGIKSFGDELMSEFNNACGNKRGCGVWVGMRASRLGVNSVDPALLESGEEPVYMAS